MKKNSKNNHSKKSAFTLVEIIVAIFVLLLAILSGFRLVGTFIATVANNQNRLTATYLAQECLENARNQRDTNWKNFDPWEKDLGTLTKDEEKKFGKFEIERSIDFPGDKQGVIRYTEQTTGTRDSLYLIEIKKSATVTCTVSWIGGGKPMKMQSILTNWQKN